jgi:hypothetical protein
VESSRNRGQAESKPGSTTVGGIPLPTRMLLVGAKHLDHLLNGDHLDAKFARESGTSCGPESASTPQ